ncbi:DUF4350 domain-containing protein [Gracilibacillus sp. YIM 98692]|uniref:DUF4350 domain-containing protein n=1 Tax=Gracilibacillus sp. YIM 98692 TaxID=2663532 RepID=UPI0013D0F668|nr:DUF4350 domain-containing protein [Gracilibacillus sp. YIM 98692]
MLHRSSNKIGIAFVLILVAVSYFSTSQTPEEYPAYLSASPSPTGTKAFYTYLDKEYQVTKETSLPSDITEKQNTIRLLLNPPLFTDQSIQKSYIDYMKDGNTLAIWKNNPDGLFNIQSDYVEELVNIDQTTVETDSSSYQALSSIPVRIQMENEDHVLLKDEYGPIAIERSIGDGKLIVALEPDWLTNDWITKEGHVALIFNTLPLDHEKHIIFDEYSYYTQEGLQAQFNLYPNWAYVLLFEGILLTILWLWYSGKRFGAIIQPRDEMVRFSDERLKALSNWYLKGKNYHASIQYQADYLKDRIKEQYGIPYHKSWIERLSAIENKVTSSNHELRQVAEELETLLHRDSLLKQEYLIWSKRLDRLQKEVESHE